MTNLFSECILEVMVLSLTCCGSSYVWTSAESLENGVLNGEIVFQSSWNQWDKNLLVFLFKVFHFNSERKMDAGESRYCGHLSWQRKRLLMGYFNF